MAIDDKTHLEILNDHYKDTCERIRENVGVRDRVFLYVLGVIGVHFLQISDREKSSEAFISLLKEHAGFQIIANVDVVTAILWFLLLFLVLRYFQANVYVNRQYDYLHRLEKRFEELIGQPSISREGASYLLKYPRFSSWMHFLYTWAFPILLLVVVTYKIYADWEGWDKVIGAYGISFVSSAMICISTVLYLGFLHVKQPD